MTYSYHSEYYSVLLLLVVGIALALIILGASFFLSFQNPDTEKLSAYECGFDPYEDARNQFDVRFYVVAILFILFDLEAMYLFPWAVSLSQIHVFGFWTMGDFILELVMGFVYAWKIGALDWE
jgi:NADH-quinone oxidoreductase subunit A